MEESNVHEETTQTRSPSLIKKTLIGLAIVVLLSVSWVGAQQFAQSAVLTSNFTAPYFTTWFGTCWMIMCFPVYSFFLFIFASKEVFLISMRESHHIFGSHNLKYSEIFSKILPFNILWILVNYLYIFALTYIATTDASAILSSNVAFVYGLSLLFLGELVYALRILASLACISGVVLFSYADGFKSGDNLIVGIVMALLSAFGAAVYKVVFKKVIGDGKLGQVSLFLSLLAATNIVFLWIPFIPLYFLGVEKIEFAAIPWSYVCISSALSLVFNFLVNFGVAYTYPLFIAVAMMMGIPLTAAIDVIVRNESFSVLRLAATLLLLAGFCLMVFPDSFNLSVNRRLGLTCSPCSSHDPEEQCRDDEDNNDVSKPFEELLIQSNNM